MATWGFCKERAQTSPDARHGPCSADTFVVTTTAQHTPRQTRLYSTRSCQLWGCHRPQSMAEGPPNPSKASLLANQTLFYGLNLFSATWVMELTLEMNHLLKVCNTWSSEVAKRHQLLQLQLMIAGKWRRAGVLEGKGATHHQSREKKQKHLYFCVVYVSVPASSLC